MSSTSNPPTAGISPHTLSELSEVKGMLSVLLQTIQMNHQATHQRFDDLRHSIDGRFDTVDQRMETIERRIEIVEANERATALKTAAAGATAGALVAAGVEAVKMAIGR